MKVIRDLMALLGIDEAMARRVESEMSQYVNFSEVTQRQFNKEARLALTVLKMVDAEKKAA